MLDGLCFFTSFVLFAVSLLAIFRAPNLVLVFLAVGATEFGHWFALASLALGPLIPHHSFVGAIASGLALVAATLFLTPAWRAARMAKDIRRKIAAVFGPTENPFRWTALFRPLASHGPTSRALTIEGAGGPLRIDFFSAASSSPAPLILVVHGGGWMAGTSEEMAGWNPWLAARGYAVASVDYRLVPTGAWPDQREDVLAAADYLRAHAAELGVDPNRIVLLGRSAGGQIASAIAAPGDRPWLRGCVCLYSPFDMSFAYEFGREDDALRSRWLLRCFLGGPPESKPAHYREASAYLTATQSAPPFLLLHGGRDELVWSAQSQRFSARLTELGVENVYLELPWATHAFDYNLHGPGGQAFAASFLAFLRTVCR